MNKRSATVLAVVALIVGVVAGGWSVAAVYKHRINRMIADYKYQKNEMGIGRLTADADRRVFQLRYLRAGNTTNVIKDEEFELENDLIDLELYLPDSNEFRSYPPYMDSLRDVKAYRAQFPYKWPSSVEEGVSEVFTLLDVQTNR